MYQLKQNQLFQTPDSNDVIIVGYGNASFHRPLFYIRIIIIQVQPWLDGGEAHSLPVTTWRLLTVPIGRVSWFWSRPSLVSRPGTTSPLTPGRIRPRPSTIPGPRSGPPSLSGSSPAPPSPLPGPRSRSPSLSRNWSFLSSRVGLGPGPPAVPRPRSRPLFVLRTRSESLSLPGPRSVLFTRSAVAAWSGSMTFHRFRTWTRSRSVSVVVRRPWPRLAPAFRSLFSSPISPAGLVRLSTRL